MTRKGILKRKLNRARKALNKAHENCTTGYNSEILFADLRVKQAHREYVKHFPEVLPRLSYIYDGKGF